jgi:hypothetical protein
MAVAVMAIAVLLVGWRFYMHGDGRQRLGRGGAAAPIATAAEAAAPGDGGG